MVLFTKDFEDPQKNAFVKVISICYHLPVFIVGYSDMNITFSLKLRKRKKKRRKRGRVEPEIVTAKKEYYSSN